MTGLNGMTRPRNGGRNWVTKEAQTTQEAKRREWRCRMKIEKEIALTRRRCIRCITRKERKEKRGTHVFSPKSRRRRTGTRIKGIRVQRNWQGGNWMVLCIQRRMRWCHEVIAEGRKERGITGTQSHQRRRQQQQHNEDDNFIDVVEWGIKVLERKTAYDRKRGSEMDTIIIISLINSWESRQNGICVKLILMRQGKVSGRYTLTKRMMCALRCSHSWNTGILDEKIMRITERKVGKLPDDCDYIFVLSYSTRNEIGSVMNKLLPSD